MRMQKHTEVANLKTEETQVSIKYGKLTETKKLQNKTTRDLFIFCVKIAKVKKRILSSSICPCTKLGCRGKSQLSGTLLKEARAVQAVKY